MAKRGNVVKLLTIFVFGGLIGTIITLLLAPRSGKETRTQVKERSLRLISQLKAARQQTRDKLNLQRISNWGNYPKVQVKFHEFEDIETLRGLLPVCSNCRKVKNDAGFWMQLEEYIQKHTDMQFSHGLCSVCIEELYGKENWFDKVKKE